MNQQQQQQMPDWQAGRRMDVGDQVRFNNEPYVVQQAHQSQGDWTPDQVPAFFGRMQGQGQYSQQQGQYPQQQQGQQGGRNDDDDDDDFDRLSDERKAEKQKFYETDKFKLAAQITGGTVAVAGLAGLGIWAYNRHNDEKKKEAWKDAHVDEDAFLTGARARADKYGQLGPGQVPPVRWVLVEQGGRLPEGALQIGYEQDGQALYAARAFHDGCASIGKTWRDLNRANIPHKEHEIIKTTYEVLVADPSAVAWRRVERGQPCAPDDFRPVEGGRDDAGNFLFVAKAACGGGVHPAEVTEGHVDAEIPFGGGVTHVDDYEILAYADHQGQQQQRY